MNVDLPVWTIRPNWKTGVLERLEWLTDVLASDTGIEQRRSVRPSPRRSFEITVNPTRQDRAYLDLVLHRLGAADWLFPLWHDQARLSDRALAGNRALAFDNTFREFEDGGYAIIYGSTFEWEVVQVAAQTADGITLTADLENDWSARAKVFPLRRARVSGTTAIAALTSRVGQSVLLFQLTDANDYPEMAGDAMVEYMGSPLLTVAPNRISEITTDHVRLLDEVDNQVGKTYRVDTANRAFAIQSHNWQVRGREAQSNFRSFLYTLRGRQRMVWLPTYNEDVVLTRDSTPSRVTIERVGLRYVGGNSPMPGRTRLWTGSEVALIGTLPAPPSASEEVLGLALPLQAAYTAGEAWSYLQAARSNQDSIELHHYADSEGTFECTSSFQTFAEGRDPSGVSYQPVPVAAKIDEPCGSPVGLNPCSRVLPEWKYKISISKSGDTFVRPQDQAIRLYISDQNPEQGIEYFNLGSDLGLIKSVGTMEAQTLYLYDSVAGGIVWQPGTWQYIVGGDFTGDILNVSISIQSRYDERSHVVVNDSRDHAGYTNYVYEWTV